MAVEYGRSCYSSAWRLFADRPDQLVRGRYYFAPDDAPHFPGVHRLGSRNWNDQEYVTEQTLGEDLLYPQKWNAGQPPAAPPNVISIGPLPEFANGSQSAAAVAVRNLIDGFIPDCYPLDERLPIWREISAYARCQVQRLWAYVICLLYEQDGAGIVALFDDWIGDQAVVNFHERTVLFPACCTVIADDWSAIAWEGTTYYEQYALQGLYSLAGPINFGGFSTLPLWYQAATRGLNFLTADGHIVGKPIFFAGHSYGAAAAMIAAARLRLVGTTPFIRYLTFGSPKPGDDRLTALIQRCQGYSLRNAGDWVTIVPFDELQIWPFLAIYPPGILRALERWSATPNSYVQHEDGFLEPRGQQTLTTETIAHILSFAFAGEPLEILNAHTLAEYRRRIDLRCQGALWPVSDAVYQECEGCSPPPLLPNGWLDLGGKTYTPLVMHIHYFSIFPFGAPFASTPDQTVYLFRLADGSYQGSTIYVWQPAPFFISLTWPVLITVDATTGTATISIPFRYQDFSGVVRLATWLQVVPHFFGQAILTQADWLTGSPPLVYSDAIVSYTIGGSSAIGALKLGGQVAAAPIGGVLMGGTIVMEDGTTCATAIPIGLGLTISGGISTVQIWYKFDVAPGTLIHVDVTCNPGVMITQWSAGNNCSSRVTVHSAITANGHTCFAATTGASTTVFFLLSSRSGPWSFAFNAGVC